MECPPGFRTGRPTLFWLRGGRPRFGILGSIPFTEYEASPQDEVDPDRAQP